MINVELANKWRKYAQMDYDIAVHDKCFYPVPVEIICYHCQQAGEKALKAVLAYHDEEIPRTHDLYRLLELCAAYYPDMLIELSVQAKRLTDFATVTRYPNDIELEETDMAIALKSAEQILSYIKKIWETEECGEDM
jgi:HEPN domain-containing protein